MKEFIAICTGMQCVDVNVFFRKIKMLEKMTSRIDEDPSRLNPRIPSENIFKHRIFPLLAARIGFEIKRAALKPTAQQQS